MDIQFYGANCISISTKRARLVVDDNLNELGAKTVAKEGDILLLTHKQNLPKGNFKLVIDGPGDYEVADISIQGLRVRSYADQTDNNSTTLYKIESDEISVVVTGHINPELSDKELEAINSVDILIIPVGGNGYTLDGAGALKVIKAVEPKLIIPTHFMDKTLKFSVPQNSLAEALKDLAMEPKETLNRLKLKSADLTDVTQLVVLERS